jgi:signal transduction histidine kinase
MELRRRTVLVYGLLAAIWLLVVGWQVQEHARVKEAARTGLRNRSKDIANTLSAFIRGLRFRGTILQDRLEPVLQELVTARTNELFKSSELISVALLNAAGEPVAFAGPLIGLGQKEKESLQKGERWGPTTVTLVHAVDLGTSVNQEGVTNPTIVLPPLHDLTNSSHDGGRSFSRRENRSESPPPAGPPAAGPPAEGPPPERDSEIGRSERDGRRDGRGEMARPGEGRSRRPFWMRNMDEKEFQALLQKRALHGLVLAMSTESLRAVATHDLWLRSIIVALATVSVLFSGLAWRNLATSSDLQIRLIRASELNTHLKEMNLAAAGLAHETRNPLNIIRGLAQMISKQQDASPEVRGKTREILDETDKVTAQLNEFINYSRPREVRRTPLALQGLIGDVARALSYDLEEKKVRLEVKGDPLTIEADEQLLRQAMFNLLLNAVQAVDGNGEIQVVAEKRGAAEAAVEVRDNGPGVPADRRTEIFKPYFTTQKQGTGLGLAVVQQIVLAHGWEIQCLANEPSGAVFRITHLKLAS